LVSLPAWIRSRFGIESETDEDIREGRGGIDVTV
jgi:hypothetical protein